MNVQKLGPGVIVLLAVMLLLLTGSCDGAGGSSPGGTDCAAEGVACTNDVDCDAVTPGATCMASACTCDP